MKKDIKYIFCDLDGTLLTDDKVFSVDNVEAIKKVEQKGIEFVVATGRMPYLTDKVMEIANAKYAICANGSIIYSKYKKIIDSQPIDEQWVKKIKETAVNNNIGMFASDSQNVRCFNRKIIELNKVEGHIKLVELSSSEMDDFLDKPIYKMSLVHPDHQFLVDISNKLAELSEGNLSQAFSSDNTVEIVTGGCTKGQGIKRFCALKNIDISQIVTIGDNMNDLSMLKIALHTACPANGCKEVKEIAEYIATVDNNNSAVAEIIEKFILS